MKHNHSRITATLVAILALAALAVGCSRERPDIRQQLLDALANQQQITSHTYSGRLSLNLGKLPIDAASQPYTSIILNALRQGDIEWSGAADASQDRREATLEFQASSGTSAFVIPIVQDAGNLYLHVPLINDEEEYFVFPAPALTDELGRLMLSSLSGLMEAMNAEWFEHHADEAAGDSYEVTIDETRWATFLDHLRQSLPNLLAPWQEVGVLSEKQAEAIQTFLSSSEADKVRLTEGRKASIRATVQDNGYLTALDMSLSITVDKVSGAAEVYEVRFSHAWDHINEEVAFTRPIPETTVSWEEILKLIR